MAPGMNADTSHNYPGKKRQSEREQPKALNGWMRGGRRILTVLFAAVVVAFIVWIPIALWNLAAGGETTEPQDLGNLSTSASRSGSTPAQAPADNAPR